MPEPYNFGPAAPDEDLVYGACRPCYQWYTSENSTVDDWIRFMQDHRIERVCCLLAEEQLAEYTDLIATYREAFGNHAVCHAPITDYDIVDETTLHETILPFLAAGVASSQRTVVHCSAGQGRTGHILALWLVTGRGYSLPQAIETVREMGRSPLEADGISQSDLRELLE